MAGGRAGELPERCNGARLNPVARAGRVCVGQTPRLASFSKARKAKVRQDAAPTIDTYSQMSVESAEEVFRKMKFKGRAAEIARDILPEIRERVEIFVRGGAGIFAVGARRADVVGR